MLDNVRRGIIQLEYLKMDRMPVDILTTPKGPTAHRLCTSRILGPRHATPTATTTKKEVPLAKKARVGEDYDDED